MELDRERALGVERAEALLKGILIPARPSVLLKVLEEQARPDADLHRIADMICGDVALAAATLKVVNSPFFGLRRKVSSVHQAVSLLGTGNIVHLVTGLMLHSAFAGVRGPFMDQFWSWSNRLALVAALVARECSGVSPEEAYTVGLFLDCGVPLMMRRYPDYPAIYEAGMRETEQTAVGYEDALLGTTHVAVGYLVGRSWQLPDVLCQCILRHHDAEDHFSLHDDSMSDIRRVLAVMQLAQHLTRTISGLPVSREWSVVGEKVLAYFGLDEAACARLMREAEEALGAASKVA